MRNANLTATIATVSPAPTLADQAAVQNHERGTTIEIVRTGTQPSRRGPEEWVRTRHGTRTRSARP